MNTMLTDKFFFWSNVEFVERCDIACARLTLFNARRGGEPAQLGRRVQQSLVRLEQNKYFVC